MPVLTLVVVALALSGGNELPRCSSYEFLIAPSTEGVPVAAPVRTFKLIMVDRAVACEEGRGPVCAVILSCQYGIDRHAGKRLTCGYPSLTTWRYH